MSEKIKYCSTCGNRAKTNTEQDACMFFSSRSHIHIINHPEEEFCSEHISFEDIETCDFCHAPIVKKDSIIYQTDDVVKILCSDCYQNLNTCKTCGTRHTCDFETNPISIPKQVMKTVRQGPAIMQTTITNPDRIAETCAKNCRCWNYEYSYCRRQDNWCQGYTEELENV